MCAYTNLDGASPISPVSGGVWRIRKKQKIADRDKRKEREDRKDKEDRVAKENQETLEEKSHNFNDEPEEQAVYSSVGKKKPTTQKVDVKI